MTSLGSPELVLIGDRSFASETSLLKSAMATLAHQVQEQRLEGIGVCHGIAIGAAFVVDDPGGRVVRALLPEAELDAEVARFQQAVQRAQQQVQQSRERLRSVLGEEHAYIFEAHLLMLQDRSFSRQIEQFIRQNRANAEWAVRAVTNHLLAVYAEIADDYLRERGSDIEDVAHRLIRILSGTQSRDLNLLAQDAIIVADDLLPSAAIELDKSRVRGVVTNVGGWASHTSIIARSLGIPAVVGLHDITSRVRTGETIIVDGGSGTVIVHPSPETLLFYSEQRGRELQQVVCDLEERELPAITPDGCEITLRANIELLEEIDALHQYNAAGIGLYRSEFLYSRAAAGLPTEDEQYEVYKVLAETSGGEGVVIRTFDLGGDWLKLEGFKPERNPALGLRAIRLMLNLEQVFRTQLRAILRAAAHGKLKIVLPLVSTLDELRAAKSLIAEVERQLRDEGVPHDEDIEIGVMVEVPAAVMLAEPMAREADFFSLGTNDLIQFMLAVDRANENVNDLFAPLHPGVLKAIKLVVEAARKAQIPLTVCGEMAAHPAHVVVLMGLGINDLSMTPSAIPLVKRVVRAVDMTAARGIAAHALSLTTPAEVNKYVQSQVARYWSQIFAVPSYSR
jgi:phosphotransferase system enzyme I (PtsI)